MYKRLVLILILLVLLLTAYGCAAQSNSLPEMSDEGASAPNPARESEEQKSFATGYTADSTAQGSVERLVIRNADISIVVAQPGDSMDAIARMAEEMSGFVVTSQLYKTYTNDGLEIPAASITIRVPVGELNKALDTIKGLVANPDTDIRSENVTGQDVTKDYTDLRSRLTNLENTEKQLQKIMDAATETEDVLNVYNQLVSVREQIEVYKGQIQYYEEAAALSAISVNLQSLEAVAPLTIGTWQPVGVARDALQALVNTLKFLANAAIWIVIFLVPVALVIIIPLRLIWLGLKRLFKGKGKNKPAAQMPVQTPAEPPAQPPTM